VEAAEVEGVIDWARRFDHMQQHTGQHILSAAFERLLQGATLSSHLGEERSSIEIAVADADWRTVERLERAANEVVWRDLEIVRHWVDDEGVKRFALRKPPKFTGHIRIVEIPEWDVSACGGTHTRRTGEVGTIKIVRWEKVRGNVRFEFLCGGRALADHGWRTEALLEAAKRRTLKDRELIAHLERAASERDELRKQVRELADKVTRREAVEQVGDPPRPVVEHRADWPRDVARTFAIQCLAAGAPWVVASTSAPDPGVTAGRAKSGTANLKEAVAGAADLARGKGGGSPDLIQLTAADGGAARAAGEWLAAWLREREAAAG
jgi:alanyl-tRNA synthetase